MPPSDPKALIENARRLDVRTTVDPSWERRLLLELANALEAALRREAELLKVARAAKAFMYRCNTNTLHGGLMRDAIAECTALGDSDGE
jgi:hypothetical protein